ncbi:hypothetical protein PF010_g29523 [Phytophthora fragariae]|uniref:Uncharacterized protein n=1 Tax=Phytophthora fragariae TaxID=53985 RepID=A0A6G0MGZ2_9STRA|nr:hypothetical protein PF010_g29523 [Phytophthora fragariae]KAE9166787.1 hypothetical protein PF004_g29045 [Phytophthora fragariae]
MLGSEAFFWVSTSSSSIALVRCCNATRRCRYCTCSFTIVRCTYIVEGNTVL